MTAGFTAGHDRHLDAAALHQLPEEIRNACAPYFAHMASLCDICRKELSKAGDLAWHESVEAASERVLTWSSGIENELARERQKALREFKELRSLSARERTTRVERAISRFANPFLVDLILDEVEAKFSGDVSTNRSLVACAQAVALRIPHHRFGSSIAITCLVRTRAFQANLERIEGNLLQADALLDSAEELFLDQGTGDPLVQAEICRFSVHIQRQRRRFDQASDHLEEALSLFKSCGHDREVLKMLLIKASLLSDQERFDEAAQISRECLSLIQDQGDALLILTATHNLACQLELAGRLDEAVTLLREKKHVYQKFPEPWAQFRYAWISGRILRALGEYSTAEGHLRGARAGFAAAGEAYDLALVSLDLALLYHQSGQVEQIPTLCAEAIPIFKAQMMSHEAIAAWLLFVEAVQEEVLSAEVIRNVRARIEAARTRPTTRPN